MTTPHIPAGFTVSTPPPPQAASLGVTDMGDGWTAEAFEDAVTGIQYIEFWNDATGEMLWYASGLPGGGDALAVTDQRWADATGSGKWMWAGIAAGVGALGGVLAQRSKFPQHNVAVVAGLGAIVLGGAGYMAYGATQGGVAGIGARRRRKTSRRGGGSQADMDPRFKEMHAHLQWAISLGYTGWNNYSGSFTDCQEAIYAAGQHAYAFLHRPVDKDAAYNAARKAHREAITICKAPSAQVGPAPRRGGELHPPVEQPPYYYGRRISGFSIPGDVRRYW